MEGGRGRVPELMQEVPAASPWPSVARFSFRLGIMLAELVVESSGVGP